MACLTPSQASPRSEPCCWSRGGVCHDDAIFALLRRSNRSQDRYASALGNVSVKVVPCPGTLCALTCPPCVATISRTM